MKSPRCYYVHCPLKCVEQKRGHKCPQPWKRKNYPRPIDCFLVMKPIQNDPLKV